ncbi:zinc finger protein 830 [Quercus suber]|uniref:Zinc finger protein 830 n=1 Tax=Quercus suber TaxID=58331 RepID=A0AAW0KDL2_QUESU
MDAQARKKAVYRAKLNAKKKDKRIDSPLVRYNELEQPVCRVCDLVLKSESHWDAHQVSRKHHELEPAIYLHVKDSYMIWWG